MRLQVGKAAMLAGHSWWVNLVVSLHDWTNLALESYESTVKI